MSRFIVLFEVTPTDEGKARYLELAAHLKGLLVGFEGFVSAERFQSLADERKILSMNVWEDEAALARWRNMAEHRMSQLEGKTKLFEHFKITVAQEVRSYSESAREAAPADSNAYPWG